MACQTRGEKSPNYPPPSEAVPSLSPFFPHLRGFHLLWYQRESTHLVLMCERITRTAPCPVCGRDARRIHSRYERTIWDLSVQNRQVILHLRVRKFYCDQPTCPRHIFAERPQRLTALDVQLPEMGQNTSHTRSVSIT
jgi:transposase